MAQNEKILLHYGHTIVYTNDDLNVIGATTSSTLRTVTAHNDTNCKYVRKFGLAYEITEVTDIEDPVDTDITITVKALDGTTLGSRVGGGAFSSGSTLATAQGCYLEATTGAGGTGTLLADIDITTDVDVGGKNFILSGETIAVSTTITFYLSATGSTYYDSNYMYGGGRHTPDGTEALPYFNITTALADLGGAFTIVTVLDSCTYDEELTISGAYTLQSALGQTPTITSGIGARATREVSHDGNNSDTAYVGKIGSDSTGTGTYQNPYLTLANAYSNIGGRTYLNIIDSNNYIENITLSTTITLEPIYGKISSMDNGTILISANNPNIYGLTIINNNATYLYCIRIDGTFGGIIKNNTISCPSYNGSGIVVVALFSGNIINNNIYTNYYGILISSTGGAAFSHSGNIIKNFVHGCNATGISFLIFGVGNATTSINNNICFGCSIGVGMSLIDPPSTYTGIINNNILFSNGSGLYIYRGAGGVVACTINKIISKNNSTDLYTNCTITITYSNYTVNSGFTIGAGCFTTDPQFCRTANPYELGLSANSPCLKTDGVEGDIGAILRTILISSNNIVINGFNIDGQEQYNNAIGKTGATDYTGLQVKWCSIYDYQGIAIDDYSGADTTTTISNCKLYYNGNGIKFTRGGNTVQESLIYSNSVYGIHSDYTINTFNHLVLYGNQYGIYFESNTLWITFQNSIINQNSLYGIYSEVSIILTYCCITDSVNSYVDISDSTNFTDNPLFINTNEGEEDFHIKTIAGGYLINSACRESADDGYDVGAYFGDYGFDSEKWEKFQLYSNPFSLDPDYVLKGRTDYDNAVGSMDKYGKGHKLTFPLIWEDNDDQTEEQVDTLRYISSLVKTVENGLTESETEIRLHILPSQKLYNGVDGVISASAKTLYNASLNLVPNKYKGWHIGIKFEEGTSLVIDSALKTATDGTKTWTVNEWEGYYLYHDYNYYLILSNTATALTLSDVDDTLINETIATYSLEKYFKILSHNKNTFYLRDDNSELIDGTYDYYIDFIVCKVDNNNFKPKMEGYYWQRQESKTGFQLLLEEK